MARKPCASYEPGTCPCCNPRPRRKARRLVRPLIPTPPDASPAPWRVETTLTEDGSGYSRSREAKIKDANGRDLIVMHGREADKTGATNLALMAKAPEYRFALYALVEDAARLVFASGDNCDPPCGCEVCLVKASIIRAREALR